jgi:hypothetical protein
MDSKIMEEFGQNQYHGYNNFVRRELTRRVLFYFENMYASSFLENNYDKLDKDFDESSREHYADAVFDDRLYLTPGDIVSKPIVMGLHHVGIYVGTFAGVFFVADFDTTYRKCAVVSIKTLQEFGMGRPITLYRSKKDSLRLPISTTFRIMSELTEYVFNYQFVTKDCDVAANFFAYGKRHCDQCSINKLRGPRPSGDTVAPSLRSVFPRISITGVVNAL